MRFCETKRLHRDARFCKGRHELFGSARSRLCQHYFEDGNSSPYPGPRRTKKVCRLLGDNQRGKRAYSENVAQGDQAPGRKGMEPKSGLTNVVGPPPHASLNASANVRAISSRGHIPFCLFGESVEWFFIPYREQGFKSLWGRHFI